MASFSHLSIFLFFPPISVRQSNMTRQSTFQTWFIIAGGAAGAVSRITGTLGKGIAALTLDDDYQKKRQEALNKRPANVGEGFARGGKGLVMVIRIQDKAVSIEITCKWDYEYKCNSWVAYQAPHLKYAIYLAWVVCPYPQCPNCAQNHEKRSVFSQICK